MKKVFTHSVEDAGEGYIPFNTDAIAPAEVEMKVDSDGNFWLVANREGFLHLARVFAEIGLRDFKGSYHFHKDVKFRFSTGSPEFSFGLVDKV